MSVRPTMFIGSSSEAKEVAEYLQAALLKDCDADVWDQHVFEPTSQALNNLLVAADRYDFATLVVSADDLAERRGIVASEPNANVTFELGLFLGALGRQRVFLLASSRDIPRLPSDLYGVTLVEYHERNDRNRRAEINPAALKIREQLGRVGARPRRGPTVSPAVQHGPVRFAADLVDGLWNGSAGVRIHPTDESTQAIWRGNALSMLAQMFVERAEDAYAAWLRPDGSCHALQLALSRNLPADYLHHAFRLDEGLAGKLWARGVAAGHCRERPHEWWVYREGCENQTYVGSVVGLAAGSGGVLGVGSNSGFAIAAGDIEVVQLFASILAASLAVEGANSERARLKQHLMVFDSSLAAYPVTRQASCGELARRNSLVEIAKGVLVDDPMVASLEEKSIDAAVECGELRMDVRQVLAAL